jgi:16S rRNA (guanine1516-N2)-methyltransferase
MVIFNIDPAYAGKSLELAKLTHLPIVKEIPQGFYFCFKENQLIVKKEELGANFFLQLDLQKEWSRFKGQKINFKKDLLSRALGYKGQETYKVLDGTLGFAKDALHMFFLGCQVIGIESNPIIFALIKDALDNQIESAKRINIYLGDSFNLLSNFMDELNCLYLDPMFEDIKKKSAPKKEMAFLRAVKSPSQDMQRVIERALELGIKRIVVKRPLKGESLYRKPNNTYKGKLIRFDVYTK